MRWNKIANYAWDWVNMKNSETDEEYTKESKIILVAFFKELILLLLWGNFYFVLFRVSNEIQ